MQEHENIMKWFKDALPPDWHVVCSDFFIDRDEIQVILTLQDQEANGLDLRRQFRDATALQRRRIGMEAHEQFGRQVSWGVRQGNQQELFTRLGVPIMTRLHMEERVVLDELIDAGIARTRSEALAWCVRLVSSHEGSWLAELQQALDGLERVRSRGPI